MNQGNAHSRTPSLRCTFHVASTRLVRVRETKGGKYGRCHTIAPTPGRRSREKPPPIFIPLASLLDGGVDWSVIFASFGCGNKQPNTSASPPGSTSVIACGC